MQNAVTISGPISFGTQYRATRAVVSRSQVTVLAYGFFGGVPVLTLILMLAIGQDISRPSPPGIPAWAALALGPVFVFVVIPLCHAVNVWQARRRNVSVQGVLAFTVTAEGFESHGGSFDVKLRWDAIHRVVETRQFFLFYVATAIAHFIPKNCVDSPEALQNIRTIIREAVGDRAKLRPA
jgi:hypothetical protein